MVKKMGGKGGEKLKLIGKFAVFTLGGGGGGEKDSIMKDPNKRWATERGNFLLPLGILFPSAFVWGEGEGRKRGLFCSLTVFGGREKGGFFRG